jgi:hypothetical protein
MKIGTVCAVLKAQCELPPGTAGRALLTAIYPYLIQGNSPSHLSSLFTMLPLPSRQRLLLVIHVPAPSSCPLRSASPYAALPPTLRSGDLRRGPAAGASGGGASRKTAQEKSPAAPRRGARDRLSHSGTMQPVESSRRMSYMVTFRS